MSTLTYVALFVPRLLGLMLGAALAIGSLLCAGGTAVLGFGSYLSYWAALGCWRRGLDLFGKGKR